ncbi:aldo/keto reductase [Bradyrhizobium yuanmingense]|uniref:aldo/keto reductase n=1 Tax=Bradyrhizobium yuanmingense TaxID=108015 RepID=UPI0021A8362F|nr:aldo/keto reductase [Bradyrhizobium sp. CB1024]UWU83183.1 aldo/keto reductase [Bradyrhizobium sp. CB1024]
MTLEATWEVGVRYFDVAPWYGFGLAERRFGRLLHAKKRGEYLLSSQLPPLRIVRELVRRGAPRRSVPACPRMISSVSSKPPDRNNPTRPANSGRGMSP